MIRWCAKAGSHDVSDNLWPKKGVSAVISLNQPLTAGWPAKKSEL
jgi:hypothetical protein